MIPNELTQKNRVKSRRKPSQLENTLIKYHTKFKSEKKKNH